MAGSTIAYPLNGAANWEAFPDILQKIQAGYMRLGLTNFDNTNEPEIAAGSTLDVNGACCVFSAAESITGWAGIANSTDVYIKVVVTGAVVTAEFTTDVPTWSATKQGWYDGNDRYIGGLYKDATDNYDIKWLYPENPSDPLNQEMIRGGQTRPLLEKIFEIGTWDMDTDASANVEVVSYGIRMENIRSADAIIYYDDFYPTYATPLQRSGAGYIGQMGGNHVTLVRISAGFFDGVGFDSDAINRGLLIIKFRA